MRHTKSSFLLPGSRRVDQAGQARADPRPATGEIGCEVVVDVGAPALGGDHTGVTQDLEMVADRRLADGAAVGEVAGARCAPLRCELSHDGEPLWVGDCLKELDVRIGALHAPSISTLVNIYA